MTQKELVDRVLAGEPILVAEYRIFAAELRRKADKEHPGKFLPMPLIEHSLEVGRHTVKMTEFLDDSAQVVSAKAPFPKGTRVAIVLESFERDGANMKARGKLEALTEK